MSDEKSGVEQARAARLRAEAELRKMRAKRPEVIELAVKSTRLRIEADDFTQLLAMAFAKR